MPVSRARRFAAPLLAAGLALALASGLSACDGSTDGDPPPAPTGSAPPTAAPVESPATATPTTTAETAPTLRVTPDPQAPAPEPPAAPVEPPAPEVSPPPDEPASPATRASEPAAAPGESSPPTAESPAPEAEPLPLFYNTYDLTGAVAEPGSYAFLEDPDDTSTAVTTYEELRDGSATALLVHKADGYGASQAALYDAVATGDLVEWKQADDCFVRYTVTEVPAPAAGAATRMFGVAWMTYAFTGCSGAIPAGTGASVNLGDLPNLGGTSLTAPIVHGIGQIVPEDWTGAVESFTVIDPPAYNTGDARYTTDIAAARLLPYWREPVTPSPFTFLNAHASAESVAYGYIARWRGLEITGSFAASRGVHTEAVWRPTATTRALVETRVIDRRPAIVVYSPQEPMYEPFLLPIVLIYDPATQARYQLDGYNSVFRDDIDTLIAVAASLFENPPRLLYDTYDLSGAVAEPGHYAFLADPDDPASAVTTYEELRDGTATALLIHTADTHGIFHADLYAAVEPGDLFEWRQASDCFVRYTVTDVKDDPAGDPPRTLLGVAWMTYAYSGCSGAIPAGTGASVNLGDLPNLGGTSLTVPIRHGTYQIIPEGWTGATEAYVPQPVPDPETLRTDDIAVARQIPDWREPELPDHWGFVRAHVHRENAICYDAAWTGTGTGIGLRIICNPVLLIGSPKNAVSRPNNGADLSVIETRVIAGRPAWVYYGVPNPTLDQWAAAVVVVYDQETGNIYQLHGLNRHLRGPNIDALIAVAASLFEPPNAP